MEYGPEFEAPWSRTLRMTSLLFSALCLGMAFAGVLTASGVARICLIVLPLVLLLGSACFTIRGYSFREGRLRIHRLLWETRLDLRGLDSAAYDPKILRGSWRLFGNGGAFSFTGIFRNADLGNYRAYLTDMSRVVVLRFPDRVVAVSPDNPVEFVDRVLHVAEEGARS